MKLVIVDPFLKENLATHKEDTFYDGELAYWEDAEGNRLWLKAFGEQDYGIDIQRAIDANVEVDWLSEIDKQNAAEDEEDKTTYYTVENAEQARSVFINGDKDVKKLSDYIEYTENNWSEVSCQTPDGKNFITDVFECDNIVGIDEFLGMNKAQVEEWISWFINDSHDSKAANINVYK